MKRSIRRDPFLYDYGGFLTLHRRVLTRKRVISAEDCVLSV